MQRSLLEGRRHADEMQPSRSFSQDVYSVGGGGASLFPNSLTTLLGLRLPCWLEPMAVPTNTSAATGRSYLDLTGFSHDELKDIAVISRSTRSCDIEKNNCLSTLVSYSYSRALWHVTRQLTRP